MATSNDTKDFDILNASDQVYVKQRSPGWGGNKFEVRTMEEQVLFKLQDEGSALRLVNNVDMVAYDTQDRKVFSLRRPATLNRQKLEVSIMDQVEAIIRQEATYAKPVLYVNDAQDRHMLRIKGDFNNLKFKIQTLDKETIGSIEMLVTWFSRDRYCITFPPNLHVTMKIVLIGATILIDYVYHSKT